MSSKSFTETHQNCSYRNPACNVGHVFHTMQINKFTFGFPIHVHLHTRQE